MAELALTRIFDEALDKALKKREFSIKYRTIVLYSPLGAELIKTTLPNRRAVSQIVRDYRILEGTSQRAATLRAFAAALSEALGSMGRRVSYQSIKNWEDGRYLPDAFSMLRLAQAAQYDWRGDFACDILAALFPESYQPMTEIGRRAVEAHKNALMLTERN